jgi:hypothetical protein
MLTVPSAGGLGLSVLFWVFSTQRSLRLHGTSEVEKIPTSINAEVFVFTFVIEKIPWEIVFA